MEKNKNIFIVGIFLVIAIIAGVVWFATKKDNKIENVSSNITFPTSEDTLFTSKTYTLKWTNTTGPSTTTSIFLVDSSLLNQGASVSIIDRAYYVPNVGTYDYTVPSGVSDGTYFFVINDETSNWFKISSKIQGQ
ncbi:MAG: Ser-Thr-rich GPI-anchored membrane family protein [Minisyncoccia bacterium]